MASAKGLYAGLETIDPSAAITRDNAAQMVWNAMNAYEVEYKTSLIADKDGKLSTQITVQDKLGLDGKSKITLLEDKYDAIAITGTLTQVKQDKGKSTYSITVKDPKYNGKNYNGDVTNKDISYSDVTKDYSDLLYQNVRVLVKPDNNGKDAVVYGVYATNKNTTQTGILKNLKMDGDKAKLDGTKYDLASAADQTVYVNGKNVTADYQTKAKEKDTVTEGAIQGFIKKYGDNATTATKYTDPAYFQPTEVSLIATDGTTNYSILKVKTFAVGKVTAVGSDYINVTIKKGDTSIATKTKLENDDWNWYSGVKKDDYVILTAAGNYGTNKGLVEKATVVTGKVTGTKSDDGVYVDGNWYTMAGKTYNASTGKAEGPAVKRPNTGSNVEMVVVNGYVYYTDTTAGSVDDVALLVEAAAKGGTGSKWEARMIFADGSDKTVDIEKNWEDKDNSSNPIRTMVEGTNDPVLVTYSVSNGVYTLTKIGTAHTYDGDTDFETAGYDAYAAVTTSASSKTDGSIKNVTVNVTNYDKTPATATKLYYESTGVVFVKYKVKTDGSADYKVVSGKTASGYNKTLTAASAVVNKSGNSYYAQAAYINLGTASTGGGADNYAVVTGDVIKNTESSTVYEIPAWNGKEAITVKTDDSSAKNLSKGDLFTYTGDVASADIDAKNANEYYVANYDSASGDITLLAKGSDNKFYSLKDDDKYNKVDSKDTVVIYVNSDDSEGVADGTITLQYLFDSDFCKVTAGATGTDANPGSDTALSGKYTVYTSTNLSEDNAPNVKAYFDDDDQITVLVVDVNRNINQWY